MRRLGPLLCCAVLLQACAFNQPTAPIREWRVHERPAKRHIARPTEDRVVVQPGDTLFRIAFDHGLDYRQLAQWNGLDDPSRIRVGQTLRLAAPAEKPPVSVQPVPIQQPAGKAPAEKLSSAKPVVTSDKENIDNQEEGPANWVWPGKGRIVTSFNESAGAKGIDIAGKLGSPILASAAGRVVYVGEGLRGYGKLIIIKHSKDLLSAYGHNKSVLVTEGEIVKQGQPIAEMGDTDAQRVELHFEIREYGKPVDPIAYLGGQPS